MSNTRAATQARRQARKAWVLEHDLYMLALRARQDRVAFARVMYAHGIFAPNDDRLIAHLLHRLKTAEMVYCAAVAVEARAIENARDA